MSTPAPTSPARNAYIDTLRGWAIFGVVCVHFAGSFVTTDVFAWSPSFHLGLALNQFFGFAVPLFVFLSGLLAGSSSKVVTLRDYYWSRFWRVGFPYLIVSALSFFLLNHYTEWQALPTISARLTWLAQRLFLFGVEPTLYFIPLILQLYVLQPALKALPRWLNRALPAVSEPRCVVGLTALLLALHLFLGYQCNRGALDYYSWGRPNVLFWMFYFFAGLHFRSLTAALSRRVLAVAATLLLLLAAGAMAWNYSHLLNHRLMGPHFEFNRLDFAYVRTEMLGYDLAMVLALAAGIGLGWSPRAGLMAWLGRFTLEIYLWHILVLYFGVWRYPEVLASCRQVPELIVIVCAGAAIVIAGVADGWGRLKAWSRRHRVEIVEVPEES